MKIRLDQVDEPFDWRETLELPAADLDRPEVVGIGEVKCRGRVSPTTGGYLLRASLSYPQTLRCVRCLKATTSPVASDVDLLILVDSSETPSGERELQEEDFGILLLQNPRLDTLPIFCEQIQLQIPMKPLCSDTCAGLCVTCGADLNAGSCGCEGETDPRWQALAGLAGGPRDTRE